MATVSLTISNPQQQSNGEIIIDVSLSGLTSSSCPNSSSCYLQAAFTSQDQTKYFGFTKNNNGQWYEYIRSPSTTYIQSTFFAFQPTNNAWSGQITLKINPDSPNYKGPGPYNINAWRYTGNSTDASGNADNVVAVTIQESTASPAPTSASTPSPSPTPAPTPSSTQPTSLFTISDTPSQINSDQSFNVKVSLSIPQNPNTVYYLKGAFKKADGTRYLGLTKKGSDWIEYGNDYSNQYKITTDNNGSWSDKLEVKLDTSDNDYKGTGDYIFKVGRYTQGGSGPIWSNEITLKVNDVSSISSSSPTPSPTIKASTSSSPAPTRTTAASPTAKNSYRLLYHNASVAGANISIVSSATPSAKIEVKSQKQVNPFLWLGLIFVFAGSACIGYIYLRKNAKNHL